MKDFPIIKRTSFLSYYSTWFLFQDKQKLSSSQLALCPSAPLFPGLVPCTGSLSRDSDRSERSFVSLGLFSPPLGQGILSVSCW